LAIINSFPTYKLFATGCTFIGLDASNETIFLGNTGLAVKAVFLFIALIGSKAKHSMGYSGSQPE
jgi:hypothetical protein